MAAPSESADGALAAAAPPPPPAAPDALPSAPPALEFGWVPGAAVRALLEEVGNFAARAAAIEAVHAAVRGLGDAGAALPTLSAFLAFLLRLVGDANFKIAISACTILEELVGRLGPDVQPYLGTIAAALTERVGDNMQMVRRAASHALAALARAVGPAPLLAALGGALVHPQWRVREEGVNAHTAALLAHPADRFDYPPTVRALAAAAADEAPRVAAAALEAFAVLHARLGALLQGMLTAVGAGEGVKRAVAQRVAALPQLGLPSLDAQGHVLHQAHVRPPSAQGATPAAASGQPAAQPAPGAPGQPLAVAAAPLPSPAAQLPYAPPSQLVTAASAPLPGSPSAPGIAWDSAALTHSRSASFTAALQPQPRFSPPPASYAATGTAGIEYSASSYSLGRGLDAAASCASVTSTRAAAGEQDASDKVEHSGGSLLNWSRPVRPPAPQGPASSPAAGRAAAAPGAVGAPGRKLQASELAAAANAAGQVPAGRGGIRSAIRSASGRVASAVRSHPRPWSVAAGASAAGPAAPLPAAGIAGSDLHSSVRNWRQQQGGGAPAPVEAEASAQSFAQVQQGELAVDGRSDSLLHWRLPSRTPSSRQAAAGLQRPQQQPQQQAPQPRIGSASFKRAFGSFRKMFGAADAPEEQQKVNGAAAAAAAGQEQGDPTRSIPAVQAQAQVEAAAVPPVPQPLVHRPPGRPALTVAVPPPGLDAEQREPQQQQPESPESPSKAADRLNRLRQLSERRRVSSAPLLPRQEPSPAGSASTAGSPAAAAHSPGSPSQRPPSAERPGLQALKARARTARLHSSGSASLGASAAASSSIYSVEAVEAVFGPDKALSSPKTVSSPTPAWSPAKPAVAATESPPKLSVVTRAASSMQWPDSPSGSGTPSGRSWKGLGFLDATAAAGSPKSGSATPGGAASDGFSPAIDTAPLEQPEAALQQALAALQAAAASQRSELDWQAQYEALRTAARLARHHPELLAPSLHALVLLAAPVVDALRSTLSRLAILLFQELAEGLGPVLDPELEAFVPLLLKRAGQASLAGRDNFLAVEADRALAALVAHAGEARTAAVLLGALGAKSPDVRAKAAMHLDACLQQHGGRLAATSAALLPRLLRAAVGLLEEGGLEARTAGKRMLWALRRLLDVTPGEFKRALARLDCKTDKARGAVWDVFESGPMPAPPLRQPSAGLRAASAGLGGGPWSPSAASGSYSPAKPSILSAADVGSPISRTSSGGSTAAAPPPAAPALHRAPSAAASRAANSSGDTSATPGSPAKRQQPAATPASPAVSRRPSRPASGRAPGAGQGGAESGSPPAASLAGLDAELQQQLEAVGAQLGSKEWKERLQGVEALQQGAAAQVAALPQGAQLWLAEALAQRVADANLRVQQQALQVLGTVLEGAGPGLAATAPTLVPAACKAVDSNNPSVRQAASAALATMTGDGWDAGAWLPPLAAALGSTAGGARSKALLLDLAVRLGPALWRSHPALVQRHLLPALCALLAAERRPELRQMVRGALAVLAKSGPALAAAAAALPPAQREEVAAICAVQRGN